MAEETSPCRQSAACAEEHACIQQRLRQQAVVVVIRHAVRAPRRVAEAPVLAHQARPVKCIGAQVRVAPPQAAQRMVAYTLVRKLYVLGETMHIPQSTEEVTCVFLHRPAPAFSWSTCAGDAEVAALCNRGQPHEARQGLFVTCWSCMPGRQPGSQSAGKARRWGAGNASSNQRRPRPRAALPEAAPGMRAHTGCRRW